MMQIIKTGVSMVDRRHEASGAPAVLAFQEMTFISLSPS